MSVRAYLLDYCRVMIAPSRSRVLRRVPLHAFLVGAITVLALSGCAAPGSTDAGAAPASPTAACPSVPEVPDAERDCAVFDPEAAMAENERYREQLPVDPATQADLDTFVEPARAALEAMPAPPTIDGVIAALVSVGIDERGIQTQGGYGTGVAFGASLGGGCLTGGVYEDGRVEVAAGGIIRDGGCLAMSGH